MAIHANPVCIFCLAEHGNMRTGCPSFDREGKDLLACNTVFFSKLLLNRSLNFSLLQKGNKLAPCWYKIFEILEKYNLYKVSFVDLIINLVNLLNS